MPVVKVRIWLGDVLATLLHVLRAPEAYYGDGSSGHNARLRQKRVKSKGHEMLVATFTQSFVLEQKAMQQSRASIAVSEERKGRSQIQGT